MGNENERDDFEEMPDKNEDADQDSPTESDNEITEADRPSHTPRQAELLTFLNHNEISHRDAVILDSVEAVSEDNFNNLKERVFQIFYDEIETSYRTARNYPNMPINAADIRAYFEAEFEEAMRLTDNLELIVSKSLSGFTQFNIEKLRSRGWLSAEHMSLLEPHAAKNPENSGKITGLISIISLLDTLDCGFIRSSSDPGSDLVSRAIGNFGQWRKKFENELNDFGNFPTPTFLQPSKRPGESQYSYPKYGVLSEKDKIQETRDKLGGSYGDIVYVFTDPNITRRSTYTPGDSANGGIFNIEGNRIFQGTFDRHDAPSMTIDKIQKLRSHYPQHDFSIDGNYIRSVAREGATQESVMSRSDAVKSYALISALRRLHIFPAYEYVEAQVLGTLRTQDLDTIIINKRIEGLWDEVCNNLPRALKTKVNQAKISGRIQIA